MNSTTNHRRVSLRSCGLLTAAAATLALGSLAATRSSAGFFDKWCWRSRCGTEPAPAPFGMEHQFVGEPGGSWTWHRSPEEERKVVIGLYNRYCIRCHGVDGRGVWDIPNVPNFTNPVWQGSRSDSQIVRIVLEGRGAVMPPFRGTLTLEEGWAMSRYLRTFLPGTETPRPDMSTPPKEKEKPSDKK